jgi:VIT1/CCC1 family predicted Fe2+/Mn2+ transporter
LTANEHHFIQRVGWLRAAVLGANDGIISTSGLLMGVAAAAIDRSGLLLTGVAGMVAGALSMAAGEYVSVSSHADTETADLQTEKIALMAEPEAEHAELADIYVQRGLDETLAHQVAKQLMAHDALGSHARDELGITEITAARPIQAAAASALSFSVGAILPLLAAFMAPASLLMGAIAASTLIGLILLGLVSARIGGANVWRAVRRIGFWGISTMSISAAIGYAFGQVI